MRIEQGVVESYKDRKLWTSLHIPSDIKGPVIVMAHGFLGFKDWAFFPWLANFFAEAGFPALRFNFSGSGMGPNTNGPFQELEAFQEDTITHQVEDLHAILADLRAGTLNPKLPAQEKLFLWGHSRGGAVCFLAAGSQPAIQGIATWATISRVNRYFYEAKQSWRKQGFAPHESSRTGQTLKYSQAFLDDAEAWGKQGDVPVFLNQLGIPLLLIHGAEDTSVPPEESESLAALNPKAHLSILAGANHKFNSSHPFTDPPPVLQEAAQGTVEFFENLLT
jgi:uncharacterized protein